MDELVSWMCWLWAIVTCWLSRLIDEDPEETIGLKERELAVDGAAQQLEKGVNDAVGPMAEDQVLVSWRHTECHIEVRYGHEKLFPLSSMSRMRVSMGVLPTSRTKNNCSMTCLGRDIEIFVRTSTSRICTGM